MRAFTLIEVLVSVIIIVMASAAFFEITQNSYRLYELFEKKKEFDLKATIPLIEEKGGSLKEIIPFDIKNDKILKALDEDIEFEKKVDLKTEFNDTRITLYRLKAYNKTHSKEIYSAEVK